MGGGSLDQISRWQIGVERRLKRGSDGSQGVDLNVPERCGGEGGVKFQRWVGGPGGEESSRVGAAMGKLRSCPPFPTRARFDQGRSRSPRPSLLVSPSGPRGRGLKSLLGQVGITHAQYHSDHLGHVAALRFDLFSQGVTECRCDLERDNHLVGLDLALAAF